MNLVETVFEIAEKFTENPIYVDINYDELTFVANDMKLEKPIEFPKKEIFDEYKTCLLELIGNSINYCYWYGKSSIRPLDACSTKMYDLVTKSFEPYDYGGRSHLLDACLDELIKILSLERFPLLEERIRHLNELRLNAKRFITTVIEYKGSTIYYLLNSMIQIFPGYASDIFLKRAFLFFAQLNRNFGWFENDMHNIPVPADYQVPKMLNYYNVLEYVDELEFAIDTEQLVPKGCLAECEIRASTIVACRELCKQTGWTMPQVDGYFWLRRKKVSTPFHLTVTSDY